MDKTVQSGMRQRALGIGAKLSLGFGVVLALMLVILVVALLRLTALMDSTHDLMEVEWRKEEAANVLAHVAAANARRTVQQAMVTAQERVVLRNQITEARGQFVEAMDFLQSSVTSEQGLQSLKDFEQLHHEYVESLQRYHQMLDDNWMGEAEMELKNQTLPMLDELQVMAASIGAMARSNAVNKGQQAIAQAMQARWVVVVIGVAALLLGLVFGWRITRGIVRPLNAAVQLAQSVAAGQLNHRITVTSADETGQLLQALQTMSTSLQSIVGDVRSSSDAIASATSEIASGNLDLSSRTEEQASALEETAAAMQELLQTVQHNLESSKQAATVAQTATQVAERGGQVVQEAVQTMQDVHASSRKIADIIGIIDGIAFQTNILALNAAVEAARAGEQGRGFAVVAAEVRALAGRSGQAAKEIKQLIDTSVAGVNAGSSLVEKAGASMAEIVANVRNVAHIVSEISASSQEQTEGLDQIKDAVVQMDLTTQQNAALVEEAASTAQALQAQAQGLVRVVSVFTTDDGAPATAAGHQPALAPVGVGQPAKPTQRSQEMPLPMA